MTDKSVMIKGWVPIDEGTPRDRPVVCWAAGWEPCFLRWKINSRVMRMLRENPALSGTMVGAYFGDPDEMDDYGLAKIGGGPTHWHPLASVPDVVSPDG